MERPQNQDQKKEVSKRRETGRARAEMFCLPTLTGDAVDNLALPGTRRRLVQRAVVGAQVAHSELGHDPAARIVDGHRLRPGPRSAQRWRSRGQVSQGPLGGVPRRQCRRASRHPASACTGFTGTGRPGERSHELRKSLWLVRHPSHQPSPTASASTSEQIGPP